MVMRPGYKQTAVGIIPTEWEVKNLREIGNVVRGGSPRPAGHPRFFGGNFIPWLTVASLTNIPESQSVVIATKGSLTEEGSNFSRILQKGQLVIVNSGARTLGIAKVLGITCCANDGIAALNGQRIGDPLFLCYYINSQTKRLRDVIAAGNDQLNLNTRRIGLIPIPFPSEAEQRDIALTLSDVDALLEGLTRLITKKRDLKQATLQRLLTQKTRLPGFTGEWKARRLRDLAEMGSGGSPKSSVPAYYDGDIPWVSISDMTKGGKVVERTERNLTALGLVSSSAQMFQTGTILYAMYASIGECSIAGRPLCTSQAILGIQPKNILDSNFLYYYLTSMKSTVKALGQQGTQANLNKGIVQNFSLNLPSIEEQKAIAEVLTDMDVELASLETLLAKRLALKNAMMAQLLTGRTRLLSLEITHV